ncbi:3-keto-5-aminohexanoate cleavage protein [Aeromicrobium panaciterrae]|uniref:3-keto-5-aminohexanoate cleavage protein n=1 Tax=Aeromicrobium panaciterrae TaxID=363861 RepID=UPI0031CF4A0D
MNPKVWIEAALNGAWTKRVQPRIPVSVNETIEDGIAAAQAGAAILHIHAYDEKSGVQNDDPATYAKIIEGIKAEVDVIIYPTISSAAQAGSEVGVVGAYRYEPATHLGQLGHLEWAIVDPGSVNFSTLDDIRADQLGMVYMNVESDIRTGFAIAEKFGAHPTMALYEPGFIRLAAAVSARYPALRQPIYRFMFSEQFTFGFPVARYGLDAYLAQLARFAPGAPWMVATLGGDITPLIPDVVSLGGHVRVGLEDAVFGCQKSNADLVTEAVEAISLAGGSPASAQDVRAA